LLQKFNSSRLADGLHSGNCFWGFPVLCAARRRYTTPPLLLPASNTPQLLYEEAVPVLERAQSLQYRTHGFLGFCLFMNSDVLFFNRVFAFVPGIRAITRGAARLDEAVLNLPGFGRAGLQVVGLAEKPVSAQVKAGLGASAASSPG
jgi:hypothetical protein